MIKYISAINDPVLTDALEEKMAKFYKKNESYYDDIDFNRSAWFDKSNLLYQDILENSLGKLICEIGCGRAGILDTKQIDPNNYSGCDFSSSLIELNKTKYPTANFKTITDPKKFPFEDEKFDIVFSVFVLEHVVRPHLFLNELIRVVKPGGKIIILCPDYFGRLSISSQKLGKLPGTGTQKLNNGNYIDAFRTVIYGRVLLPMFFYWKLRNAGRKSVFLLNNDPSCFSFPFSPDVDAVYVTHKEEISNELNNLGAKPLEIKSDLKDFAKLKRWIYLVHEVN
ncbi:class I SAM-dependent methyltransferase [Flavisolibacter ginsengisoli]|jgi:SAM-dependent methyltransferase|uniref:Methyltransferase domain-containing protein n=1 Tax=Flavisolibacter ginsengisoli DSM 18119 TaxID=1121884 RepID=A0A1M5E1S1_9BACT|nr:class I SAM-dependent methyltransferase [Flavisolibacter ginsengisoli]SHF73116.1 Methyltransferase domain-containing protein [Flavisolibacter ginsengisoli DSM 18119]